MKDIIRLGETTTHGGTVLGAFSQTNLTGKPIAGVGHMVSCQKMQSRAPLTEGSSTCGVDGTPAALDGMKTAYGVSLIANGPKGSVVSQ